MQGEGQRLPSVEAICLKLAQGTDENVGDLALMLLARELSVENPMNNFGFSALDLLPEKERLTISYDRSTSHADRHEIVSEISKGGSLLTLLMRHCDFYMPDDQVGSSAVAAAHSHIYQGKPRLSVDRKEMVYVDLVDSGLRNLRKYGCAAIIGTSSSGKTVIGDFILRSEIEKGYSCIWIDLSDPATTFVGIFAALLATPREAHVLLVIDDVQSSPELARRLGRLMLGLRDSVEVLWIAWPDARAIVSEFVPRLAVVECSGGTIAKRIIAGANIPSTVVSDLLSLGAGDTLITKLAREFYLANSRVPTMVEISGAAFDMLLEGIQAGDIDYVALGSLAALSMFEIDAKLDLLSVDIGRGIEHLVDKGIARRKGGYIVLGHRVIARLVLRHLSERQLVPDEFNSIQFAVQYLRGAGPAQIKQTLDRLDLVSVASHDDQFGAAFLAECWTSLRTLVHLLVRQAESDPTWGDNVASAVFAAEVFSALGMEHEWTNTAQYIRGRWSYSAPVAEKVSLQYSPLSTGTEPAELDDFREIKDRMIWEDSVEPVSDWEPAASIDESRFHTNWVLGLLLGFESSALDRDERRVAALLDMAAGAQDASGWFYPKRVPWVTARVIIGAAGLGAFDGARELVDRAGRWLRTPRPRGPRSFGVWRAHTGQWNTDLQMTAMALLALGRAGVSAADPAVKLGLAYLRDGRHEWYRTGKEIDCAQALEAALVLGGTWRDYDREIRSLIAWAQDATSWQDSGALASQVHDESSKAPAVASSLVAIIWETVRSELPLLLEGVSGTSSESDQEQDGFRLSVLVAREQLNDLLTVARASVADRRRLVEGGRASEPVKSALRKWEDELKLLLELAERVSLSVDFVSSDLAEKVRLASVSVAELRGVR